MSGKIRRAPFNVPRLSRFSISPDCRIFEPESSGDIKAKVEEGILRGTTVSEPNTSTTTAEASVELPCDKGKNPGIDISPESTSYQLSMEVSTHTSVVEGCRDNSSTNEPVKGEAKNESRTGLTDSERTKLRYEKAVIQLKESLELGRTRWKEFTFPDSHLVPKTISQMREELEKTLRLWKFSKENPDLWSKSKRMVAQAFTATSPFVKNFLTVAINAQQVALSI